MDISQQSAWESALECDPESAFGCVIALNSAVQIKTAEKNRKSLFECIIAPAYEPKALDILSKKTNRRILSLSPMGEYRTEPAIRQVEGGWLSQSQGPPPIDWDSLECVTNQKLSEGGISLAKFGSTVISEVQSNAIVIVRATDNGMATVGVGPGQTSRIEAVRIAARRAGERAQGAMLISDAFFPFKDGVVESKQIGIRTIVQPGGSIRDKEVIDAANEYGIEMIFTGIRLFRH